MIPPDTQSLINAIRSGEHLRLIDHEVTGLLSWMAGSSRSREARELVKAFGEAGKHEQATARGFLLLDRTLFKDQQLLEEIAGVAQNRSSDERRRRYRLLLSAFHPDRYPNRAGWLTERSQIITIAYSRFKSGKAPIRPLLPVVKRRPAVVRKRPRRFVRPSTKWLTRLARTLQQQFGGDPWLAQKIIGGLALVLVLPLVSVLLDTQAPLPFHSEPDEAQTSTATPSGQQTTEPARSGASAIAVASTDSQAGPVGSDGGQDIGASPDEQALTERMAERASDRLEAVEPGAKDEAQEPALVASNDPQPNRRAQDVRATAQASEAESELIPAEARPADAQSPASAVERRTGRANESLAGLESRSASSNTPLNRTPTRQAERRREPEPSADSASRNAAPLPSGRESAATQAMVLESPDRAENASIAAVDPQEIRPVKPLNRAPARPGDLPAPASGGSAMDEHESPDPANTQLVQADRPNDQPPEARGSLLLGPLGSHQIGTLLQQYQLAMEQADFETLSDLVGVELAEEIQNLFPELFESNLQHRVDLSIVQSQREGDQWVVQLQQNVGISAIDRRARNFSHRAEFRFRTDPFAIRFVEMDF